MGSLDQGLSKAITTQNIQVSKYYNVGAYAMTGNADAIKALYNILLNMRDWPLNPAIIKSFMCNVSLLC